MGYTHYFTHTAITDEVWNLICEDVKKLFNDLPEDIKLAGWIGISDDDGNWVLATKAEDIVDNEKILFNGFPEEFSYETFMLKRRGSSGFQFCKTARKPYDLMVCACLVAYCFHSFETMDWGSDGDLEDWSDALNFVSSTLGADYVMKFRIEADLQ